MSLRNIDIKLIHFFRKISVPFARLGLFIVFFWFGALKVVGLSPANVLVQELFEKTVHMMTFGQFIVLFGFFECIIGILFIIPKLERIVIPLLFLHMVMTFMPLFVLPDITWNGFLVPSLEGQYIIKNLALIACALGVASVMPSKKARETPQTVVLE